MGIANRVTGSALVTSPFCDWHLLFLWLHTTAYTHLLFHVSFSSSFPFFSLYLSVNLVLDSRSLFRCSLFKFSLFSIFGFLFAHSFTIIIYKTLNCHLENNLGLLSVAYQHYHQCHQSSHLFHCLQDCSQAKDRWLWSVVVDEQCPFSFAFSSNS